jgi:hypothetical protein
MIAYLSLKSPLGLFTIACYGVRMVVSDLDIWRAANLLIVKLGVGAEFEAARMADVMLERGDRDGKLVWLRIKQAIVELQAEPSGLTH